MKRLVLSLVCLFAAIVLVSPLYAGSKPSPLPYSYFRLGNSKDVTSSTTGGIVLMGGGMDVDSAFQWMCNKSGGGDFLVIRATGTDAYNPYIDQLCPGANSVATLIIPTRAAAGDSRVATIIQNAEAIFIAGGDQSDYINYWKDTPVQAALNTQIANGVPVGGTSAGLNVLSEFIYSAQANKGVTSSQALANPFNRYMSFDRNFANLPVLQGVLADPHFFERDRMGRDLAFMCRLYQSGWSTALRAISVDEETALLIDRHGAATVAGTGSVYFMKAPGAPQVCASNTPLTYRNIGVYRIDGTGSFDLGTWSGTKGVAYSVTAEKGVLSSTQSGGSPY
jgi:cyanophycinase